MGFLIQHQCLCLVCHRSLHLLQHQLTLYQNQIYQTQVHRDFLYFLADDSSDGPDLFICRNQLFLQNGDPPRRLGGLGLRDLARHGRYCYCFDSIQYHDQKCKSFLCKSSYLHHPNCSHPLGSFGWGSTTFRPLLGDSCSNYWRLGRK